MKKETKTSGDRRRPPGPPRVGIGTMELPQEDDKNVTVKKSLLVRMMKWIKDRKLINEVKKKLR